MESVNTTSLRTGTNNTGLLKARGKFVWPEALTDPRAGRGDLGAAQSRSIRSTRRRCSRPANGKVGRQSAERAEWPDFRASTTQLTRSVGDVTFRVLQRRQTVSCTNLDRRG